MAPLVRTMVLLALLGEATAFRPQLGAVGSASLAARSNHGSLAQRTSAPVRMQPRQVIAEQDYKVVRRVELLLHGI